MKYLVFLSFAIFSLDGFSQTEMPLKIKTAFENRFHDVTGVEWTLIEGKYSIEFSEGTIVKNAIYSSTGEWLETISFIAEDELPDNISNHILSTFPDGYINFTEKIESKSGALIYRVYVDTDNSSFINEYDTNGKLVSSKKEAYEEILDDSND